MNVFYGPHFVVKAKKARRLMEPVSDKEVNSIVWIEMENPCF